MKKGGSRFNPPRLAIGAERQLVVTKKSTPAHIKAWLEDGTREVLVVLVDRADDIIRDCVKMAIGFGLPVIYRCPEDVRRQLEVALA
jgi:hypothetical protein